MESFRRIRERLGLTQSAIAKPLGVTQGNISFYEKGQTIPPPVAAKLIKLAADHGLCLSFDHVYGMAELPVATEGAPDVPQAQQEAVRDAA